jgi:hypothetical protein
VRQRADVKWLKTAREDARPTSLTENCRVKDARAAKDFYERLIKSVLDQVERHFISAYRNYFRRFDFS